MTLCYLCLGSNQKSPQRILRHAIKAMRAFPKTSINKVSQIYQTKAWGHTRQQDFFNAVVAIDTTLTPFGLLSYCMNLEKKLGRVRKKTWGPRILDVDIILYGKLTLNTPTLKLPHPHYLNRAFVLTPLLEIKKPEGKTY